MAMDDKSTILYYSKNTLNILYMRQCQKKKQERNHGHEMARGWKFVKLELKNAIK